MLKISFLVVAILAGLGAFLVTHLKVADKITTLRADLATATDERNAAKEAEAKASKEARAAKDEAEQKQKELAETQSNLEAATSRATTQERRANDTERQLNEARGSLTEAQRDLAAWRALGRAVDQIERDLETLRKTAALNAQLVETNKDLQIHLNDTRRRLQAYEGERELPPELPEKLKGKVIAVDPKWDFVVINVGSEHKFGDDKRLVERGELLVSRHGRLVAKLRVTSVTATNAIANVLPEWKQADVMEEDEVLPAPPLIR
jgi:hypothetical protein